MIRDEGSRFGTLLNGAQVRLSFLRDGDVISLGKVELEFRTHSGDLGSTSQTNHSQLEGDAFFELMNRKHPGATLGMITFIELAADPLWIQTEADLLFPDDPATAQGFVEKVSSLYARQAEKARAVLPEILGVDHGDDHEAHH